MFQLTILFSKCGEMEKVAQEMTFDYERSCLKYDIFALKTLYHVLHLSPKFYSESVEKATIGTYLLRAVSRGVRIQLVL